MEHSGDELGILHYAEGDADAFEAVAEVPEVLDYDLERVDGDSFYVYIRDATTASLREMLSSLRTGTVVIVSPIVYRGDS